MAYTKPFTPNSQLGQFAEQFTSQVTPNQPVQTSLSPLVYYFSKSMGKHVKISEMDEKHLVNAFNSIARNNSVNSAIDMLNLIATNQQAAGLHAEITFRLLKLMERGKGVYGMAGSPE